MYKELSQKQLTQVASYRKEVLAAQSAPPVQHRTVRSVTLQITGFDGVERRAEFELTEGEGIFDKLIQSAAQLTALEVGEALGLANNTR